MRGQKAKAGWEEALEIDHPTMRWGERLLQVARQGLALQICLPYICVFFSFFGFFNCPRCLCKCCFDPQIETPYLPAPAFCWWCL